MYNIIDNCFKDKAHKIKGFQHSVIIKSSVAKVGNRVILALNSLFNNGSNDNPTNKVGIVSGENGSFFKGCMGT
jgi:hypothetical protein